MVETKFVGEQNVQGAPTEVVGNESKTVDEHIKQAPAGDRTVVVENVDIPGDSVRRDLVLMSALCAVTDVSSAVACHTGLRFCRVACEEHIACQPVHLVPAAAPTTSTLQLTKHYV